MEDNDGTSSLQSLQHVGRIELYPKSSMESEDKDLVIPFSELYGEAISYLGRSADGTLALSNYRFYYQVTDSNTFHNIPLGLIEQIEVRDILYLHIYCRDCRVCRVGFSSSEQCSEWLRKLQKATSPPDDVKKLFAFAMYAWVTEQGSDEVMSNLSRDPDNSASDNFKLEVERLGFDVTEKGPWRISYLNTDYNLCNSYPQKLLAPACISDDVLKAAAKFRSAHRLPAVVWRHRINGAVIARCSQPEVGWLGWRSTEDEKFLKAIADVCPSDVPGRSKPLLVMDARSYASAVANRARGGGSECVEYYPNCDIQFMSLVNIHSVRKSFSALRNICHPTVDQPNWFSLLEGSHWLHYMAGLLHAAITVASTIERDGRSVLVHCSDGWDRTSQIVSLAELLLDPYYRTTEGFRILVEREWLEFGHKFADRCGLTDDPNEQSPVFLQWLDCVHNIAKQFPCAFQINQNYLVKLAQHTYSNMFGTFLCNTNKERREQSVTSRTFSVWSLLQSPQYINQLYSSQHQVLRPSCNIRDLVLWRELYLDTSSVCDRLQGDLVSPLQQDSSVNIDGEFVNGEDLNDSNEERVAHQDELSFIKNEEDGNATKDQVNIISQPKLLKEICYESTSGVDCISKQDCGQDDQYKINGDIISKRNDKSEVDVSVESSTETLVPTRSSSESPQDPQNNLECPLPVYGRPVPTLLDPLDGLTPLKDDIQQRLTQIVFEHKAKEAAWERELHSNRQALVQQVCSQCSHSNPPERLDDDGSVCSTEVSWEAVEEHETRPTLWVPDHAVSHCMGCQNLFWLGRRKHHCRSCGKIFCADCSENAVALPEEQLYDPVRVCTNCYNPPVTCKQAAGNEAQALMQPTHTHA